MKKSKELAVTEEQTQAKALSLKKYWGELREAPADVAYVVARLTLTYGLDPFLGHVWVTNGKPSVTHAGLIHHAVNVKGTLDGIDVRAATEDERIAFYVPESPPVDEVLFRAEVRVTNKAYPFVAWGRAGLKNLKGGQAMWKQEMAQKRAVNRALRSAYSIGVTSAEEYEEAGVGVVGHSASTPTPTSVKSSVPTATVLDEVIPKGEFKGQTWRAVLATAPGMFYFTELLERTTAPEGIAHLKEIEKAWNAMRE